MSGWGNYKGVSDGGWDSNDRGWSGRDNQGWNSSGDRGWSSNDGWSRSKGWSNESSGGYGNSRGAGWNEVDWGANLAAKDWPSLNLVEITKNFHDEHPDVARRSREEVLEIRKKLDIEVLDGDGDDRDLPKPWTCFNEASFPDWLQSALDVFKEPTAIQVAVWPIAMQGRDLVGISDTGSGKTLAYVLPMLIHIVAQAEVRAGEGPVGVVLSPSRELSKQIVEVIAQFSGPTGIKSVAIYGGESVREQGDSLQEKNDVIVATPGRFIQLLNEGWTNLNRVTYVVLDEADQILDRGFKDQVALILSQVRPDRQVLMFSATWPKEVQQLANEHCTADEFPPVTIRIGGDRLAACRTIKQMTQVLQEEAKLVQLKEAITRCKCHVRGNPTKLIVFVKSKARVDDLVWTLKADNFEVEAMHGGMRQEERFKVLNDFRNGQLSCVVATDCLGRGHDIPRVKYVVNYDVPDVIEDYIHRVGRTGRAGEAGFSMAFLTDNDYLLAEPLIAVLRATAQPVAPELEELAKKAKGGVNEAWGNVADEEENAWADWRK